MLMQYVFMLGKSSVYAFFHGNQPLVYGIAFQHVFFQHRGCPTAKLCGIGAIDTIADGDNHVKIVEINLAIDLSVAFFSNYSNFLSSCFRVELTGFVNALYMVGYIVLFYIKQYGHLLLRQPHGFVFQLDFQRELVVRLVKHNFAFVRLGGKKCSVFVLIHNRTTIMAQSYNLQ